MQGTKEVINAMTAEDIIAKEIGMLLFGAQRQLRDARDLINERDHTIAWANTSLALDEVDKAIRMLRQDYANAPRFV